MISNELKGKRIALLGGIGARPESRQQLIDDLGLESLDWVYGERNKTREYSTFIDSLYPGKYDYLFVLTKFISHKVWDMLKSVKFDLPVIRVNGSYNSEGFVKALFEQTKQDAPEESVEQAPTTVTKRLLEPARAHEGPIPTQDTVKEAPGNQDEAFIRLQEAKKKADQRIIALEIQVSKLTRHQQDHQVLTATQEFHTNVHKFLDDMPVPTWLHEADTKLVRVMAKHDIELKPPAKVKKTQNEEIMRSNLLLGKMFMEARGFLKSLNERAFRDRYGACMLCKRHIGVGCNEECPSWRLKKLSEHIEADLEIIKVETPAERKSWFKDFIGG